MAIGPVEYIIVGFPGNKFNGEIAPELGKLVESGTIRILDLVFITKDADGNVARRRVRGPRRRRPVQRPRGRGRRADQRGGHRVRRRRARAELVRRPADLGGRLGGAVRRGDARLRRRAHRGLPHPPRPDRSRRGRAGRGRLTATHPDTNEHTRRRHVATSTNRPSRGHHRGRRRHRRPHAEPRRPTPGPPRPLTAATDLVDHTRGDDLARLRLSLLGLFWTMLWCSCGSPGS